MPRASAPFEGMARHPRPAYCSAKRPGFDLAQKAEIVFRLVYWLLNGSLEAAMIIERLSREHRNIEMLLAVLERELEIFDRGDRPD